MTRNQSQTQLPPESFNEYPPSPKFQSTFSFQPQSQPQSYPQIDSFASINVNPTHQIQQGPQFQHQAYYQPQSQSKL